MQYHALIHSSYERPYEGLSSCLPSVLHSNRKLVHMLHSVVFPFVFDLK